MTTRNDVSAYEARDAYGIIQASGKTTGLVSLVQRKLGIGYDHARAIIAHLEAAGVLSPEDDRGRRRLIQEGADRCPNLP